jgi:hypothetical protein
MCGSDSGASAIEERKSSMKRVLFIVCGILGMGALTAVGVAATSHTSATTFRLVEKGESFHFVDNPPFGGQDRPPSQGDSLTLTSSLWTTDGKRAGTLRATCTVTEGGSGAGSSTCYGTFGLKGGQLAGITTVRGEGRITRVAIVGGTGSYEGARGSVISVTRRSNDRFSDDTIHLMG